MDVRWTLNIENFGKIEQAKIEISPMMLFVGDNNSGKSYVMSLLWGLLTFSGELFEPNAFESDEYKRCEEWLENLKSDELITIDSEIESNLMAWFNVLLNRDKERIVERIFNYPISISQLFVSNYKSTVQPKVVLLGKHELSERFNDDPTVCVLFRDLKAEVVLTYLCYWFLFGHFGTWGNPLYLPASRTGFMLTYKTLLANLVDPLGSKLKLQNEEHYKSQLPLPITRFLRLIVQTEIKAGSKFEEIADFIEQKIMLGQVKKDNSPVPNFRFKPNGAHEELPLHVTSSLVSELAPIVWFLRAEDSFAPFIIEEPEAHLHLKMQKLLTTALVRLVSYGLPVWLTTHSDTVLQQVNNMIKLYHHKDREQMAQELGYDIEIDPLDPQNASAYQFTVRDDGKTIIEPLRLTQYGFAVPTFNETLVNLTDETLKLQESEEDAD